MKQLSLFIHIIFCMCFVIHSSHFLSAFIFVQIDTKDILFICGGAFIDLEKTISERSSDVTY